MLRLDMGLGGFGGGLSPASPSDIIWWGNGGVESGTDNVINDLIGTLDDANYVENNCINFAVNTVDNIDTGVALNFGSNDYSGWVTFNLSSNPTSDYLIDGRDADNDGFRVMWLDADFSGGDNRVLISHNSTDLSVYGAADLDDGEVHTIEWRKVGSTLYGSVDGGTEYSTSISGNIDVTTSARAGNQSYATAIGMVGNLFEAQVDGYFHYTCAEGDGSTVYDRTDNGNNGTITGATWTTDNGPANNIENGFDLWTKDVGGDELRVPLESDGTSIKGSGDTITGYTWQAKYLGGYAHNTAESTQRQTDSTFSSGTVNFWSADGASIDDKTYTEKLAHYNSINGTYGMWFRVVDGLIVDEVQYPLANELTPAEVERNEVYFGGTSGAVRDVDGELVTDVNGYVVFSE